MSEGAENGLIDLWVTTKLQQGELSRFGVKLYRAYCKRLIKNMGLTPEQVLERAKTDINRLWTQAKNTNGMTAAGRHKSLLAFRGFLRFNGFYPPADKLSHKKQREERKKRGRLTWDEALSVCNAASKPYNMIFRLMLHAGWGASEFLEFNQAENWAGVKSYLTNNPQAEYYRFDFEGRKSNDQPFYSLIPATILREIIASEIPLPIGTITGLQLGHAHYSAALNYLDSAFNTAKARAPIPPLKGRVTLHELRDVFRTRATLCKVDYEPAEFALGHELDERGYQKCFNDEPYMWSELRKVYGPSLLVVSDSADVWAVLEAAIRKDPVKARAFIEAVKGIEIKAEPESPSARR
jgi:integrase